MLKNKITQQEIAFYKLYSERKTNKERFIPVWEFVGEFFIKDLNRWELMSYTCPHRVFEIYSENPELIERKMLTGKSGSRYYGYRLNQKCNASLIKSPKLISFYKLIKKNQTHE
jgi:hypothetical protein